MATAPLTEEQKQKAITALNEMLGITDDAPTEELRLRDAAPEDYTHCTTINDATDGPSFVMYLSRLRADADRPNWPRTDVAVVSCSDGTLGLSVDLDASGRAALRKWLGTAFPEDYAEEREREQADRNAMADRAWSVLP